ncbi:DUF6534 domain-containing protein [Pleurotus pulmonarius]
MSETEPVVVAPLLFGLVVSCPFFGISIAQSIYYYKTYPTDSRSLKSFIGVLTLLESVHTILITQSTKYWYLDSGLKPTFPPTLLASGYVTYVVISLVQMAYMGRVYALSAGNKWISTILCLMTSIQIICGFGMNSTLATHVVIISIHHTSAEIFGGLQLAASVVCDVLITSSLVFYLRDNRGEFKRTQNVVDRLVIYSINIGMVTSIISLSALITRQWFAMPDNFIFSTFHILIGKVYFNSWLVTLNARKTMRKHLDGRLLSLPFPPPSLLPSHSISVDLSSQAEWRVFACRNLPVIQLHGP